MSDTSALKEARAVDQARRQVESVCEMVAALQAAGDDGDAYQEAQRTIQDDALSVEVRSAWQSAGSILEPSEFRIVLCTGGPHVELRGCLNEHNEPCSVEVHYADWGESGEYRGMDEAQRDALLEYCQHFYFDYS